MKVQKALMCSLAQSQNKGLSEHQRRANQLHTDPSSPSSPKAERQVCDRQSRKTRGCCNLGPRDSIFPKLWAGSQLLTTSSWDPGWLTSGRRVAASDQHPRGDTQHNLRRCSCGALAILVGTGEVFKMLSLPGQWACQAPGHLSSSDLGRAQNTFLAESVPWQSTWEPKWLREVHETQGPLGTVPLQSTLEPEQSRPVKHMLLWVVANPVCPYTVSTPHTCQWYFFAVFLPPHNTTEQVSLNKWPPSSPLCQGRNYTLKKLAKGGSQNKQRRGNCSGSDRHNILKPCS